ncbi:MAG TPA: PKD domain-containing protein [Solirubrobacteraceae bacterium]
MNMSMSASTRSSRRGRTSTLRAATLLATLAIMAIAATPAAGRGGPGWGPHSPRLYSPQGAHLPFGGAQQQVCGSILAGAGQCLIHILQPGGGGGATTPLARNGSTIVNPTGLAPGTLKSVYGYATAATAGAGETIALVDAYNDPNAASDLSKFSAQYGLPAATFAQVNQTGGSSLPATNASWDLEISLDIEWAHAIAPGANILLVEASSNSLANLLAAEHYAAAHANYVSNSWGSSEFSGEAADDSNFTATGVSYFAAAGDKGSEMLWPSASPDVTSVGGSSLTLTSGDTLAQETAWSESGGGCSRYESPNPAQLTGSISCAGRRATPDVALDADPNSGMSVYDSVTYEGQSGWWTVGGTSASTVLWAAESAVSGSDVNASYVYANPANIPFRDIASGSNGHPALTGFDLVTGLGSWSYTPGAPTGPIATRGASGVSLSWNAPTGAPPTEYVVWRGTAPGEETTQVTSLTAPATSYTDTSATSATTTYYYEVQALDGAGAGPFSSQALTAPPSTPPVAKFSKSCSGATCSFTSTSTDESGTIDAYAWNGGNGKTGSAAKFSDTYATAGKYTVTLKVTNTAGQASGLAEGPVTCSVTTTRQRGRTQSTLTCT